MDTDGESSRDKREHEQPSRKRLFATEKEPAQANGSEEAKKQKEDDADQVRWEKLSATVEEIKESNSKMGEQLKELLDEKRGNNTNQSMGRKFVLTQTFYNLDALAEGNPCESEWRHYFGFDWRIVAEREEGELQLRLEHQDPTEADEENIDTFFEATLTTNETSYHPSKWLTMSLRGTYQIHQDLTIGGELHCDLDGITEVTVQISVELGKSGRKIEKINNFGIKDNKTTVTLKVEEEKFHVSKEWLAVQSTYFEKLFFNEKCAEFGKEEVELKETDPASFQEYMDVLYGEDIVNDDNVEDILFMADRYPARLVFQKCENFLMLESALSLKKKYDMSVTYKLPKLTNQCISRIESREQYAEIVTDLVDKTDMATLKALVMRVKDLQ